MWCEDRGQGERKGKREGGTCSLCSDWYHLMWCEGRGQGERKGERGREVPVFSVVTGTDELPW